MAGNLIVGQSGGPTAVINASLAGVIHAAMSSPQIGGIIGALNGIKGVLQEELVDLRREDTRTIDLLRGTPAAALGTSRHKLTEDEYERLLQVFQAHDVHYLCLIGGNDSMDTAHKLGQMAGYTGYELQVMGVPKTVDNDLVATDHCPGYGSAARFVAFTMRDTGMDSRSGALSTPVKVVEIMGRHAGWLTASAALAREGSANGAPHLIYVPERPTSLQEILSDTQRVYEERGFVVIALSEGVRDTGGEFLGSAASSVDAFGHRQLGGVSATIAHEISTQLGLKARFEKPDTMQRSSSVLASSIDQMEAYAVGQEAVQAMTRGISGQMVTLEREPGREYGCRTGLVDLRQVAGVEKFLPDAFLSQDGRDVTPAFLEYVRPLIGGPLPPVAELALHTLDKRLPRWNE